MTLMAGPIDTRVNPTKVNELANSKPMEWFERNLIASVPLRYPGAFRRVYPGFVQLAAFMSMNVERHVKAHRDLYDNLAKGEHEKAQVTKAFYDEYFAVLDLTAEFYLETVRLVFQECALPLGKLEWQGEPVEPRAIKRTMLLTVEGERDDICAVGQTAAAHDLCTGLRPYLKRHHMQPGVGHYGVFSGNRWTNQIYPLVKNVILAVNECRWHPIDQQVMRVRFGRRHKWPRSCPSGAGDTPERTTRGGCRPPTMAAEPGPLAVSIGRMALVVIDMQRISGVEASALPSATIFRASRALWDRALMSWPPRGAPAFSSSIPAKATEPI
jgi:hypothetical protein